jgi:hypothetical protein
LNQVLKSRRRFFHDGFHNKAAIERIFPLYVLLFPKEYLLTDLQTFPSIRRKTDSALQKMKNHSLAVT